MLDELEEPIISLTYEKHRLGTSKGRLGANT